MRPIKFRGLSIEPLAKADDWLYGSIIHMNYDDKNAYIDNQEVKFESVGQYTGLKDKNGREIYEKDVVHLHIPSEPYMIQGDGWVDVDKTEEIDVIGLITFKYAMFGIAPSDTDIFPLDDLEFTEVVGNIYENPELLEGAHNG